MIVAYVGWDQKSGGWCEPDNDIGEFHMRSWRFFRRHAVIDERVNRYTVNKGGNAESFRPYFKEEGFFIFTFC